MGACISNTFSADFRRLGLPIFLGAAVFAVITLLVLLLAAGWLIGAAIIAALGVFFFVFLHFMVVLLINAIIVCGRTK